MSLSLSTAFSTVATPGSRAHCIPGRNLSQAMSSTVQRIAIEQRSQARRRRFAKADPLFRAGSANGHNRASSSVRSQRAHEDKGKRGKLAARLDTETSLPSNSAR